MNTPHISTDPAAPFKPALQRFLSAKDLRERCGITYTRMHLTRLEAAGKFPKRFYPTPGRCAWIEQEIAEWQMERVANRDVELCKPVNAIVRSKAGSRSAAK